MKAQESKCSFARLEYQLELAAANSRYRRFRDRQCPEVMEVVNSFLVEVLKGVAIRTAAAMKDSTSATIKGEEAVRGAANNISVEEEILAFQRAHADLFPGVFPRTRG